MIEQCCGTTCDKRKLEQELKCIGAKEFVEFLEENLREDCSTEAISKLLFEYQCGVAGMHCVNM